MIDTRKDIVSISSHGMPATVLVYYHFSEQKSKVQDGQILGTVFINTYLHWVENKQCE